MVQSRLTQRVLLSALVGSLLFAAPALAAVPISSWGFVTLFSDTTYVVTTDLTEPAGTQGVSGTVAIRIPPSVHDIVIEGGGFTIDGRDTGGSPDLDIGVAMSGIASGSVRDIVIRDLRLTDVSIGVQIQDYVCRAVVEDCEFAACVNQAGIELANVIGGAEMRWITVRDNWFHDGAGVPILVRNTANAGPGVAVMEHIAVVANVVHDYRRSPAFPEPWNAAIVLRHGGSELRVWDNLMVGGTGESGVFMTSDDSSDQPYDAVSIRGNVLAGASGNVRSAGAQNASGITLDRVTTTTGDFSTWVVTGNYLVQNEAYGIELLTGTNTPASLPADGNWWGEDGTVTGAFGNGALNTTDASPRDIADGILVIPSRSAGGDRAVAAVGGFAGVAVILNQNDGAPGIRGFDVDYDHTASFAYRRTIEGPFLDLQAPTVQFYDIPRIGGSGNERTASAAILGGGAPLAVGNGVLFLTVLAGTSEDEAPAADFLLQGAALRDPGNFPVAIAALTDADRPIDDTPPAATVTPPGGNPCVGSETAPVGVAVSDDFALEDVAYRFHRIDLAPGCWTALSLDEPGTAYTGPASVPVTFGFGEGTYVFELLATDDAGNAAIERLFLSFDETPPADFTGTTTALAVPGPGTPAAEEVRFTWNGSFEAGADLRLHYLPYGGTPGNYAYPEYDDAGPVPGPHFPGPTEGTVIDLPDVASGSVVIPFTIAERSYYYFTLYVFDCAGNPSPGASSTVRKNALSYYLGDWDSHSPPACPGSPEYTSGNGEVHYCDLIGMSRAFATTPSDPNYSAYVDIGPTTPGPSPRDLPVTDNVIDFEDLIIFAVNFETVFPFAGDDETVLADERTGRIGSVRLTLDVTSREEDRVLARLRVDGDVEELLGLEAVILTPGFELVRVRPGPIVPDSHFLIAVPHKDGWTFNLALLGPEARLATAGVVGEIELRPTGSLDEPTCRLQSHKLRDRRNRELDGSGGVAAVGTGPPASDIPRTFALAEPVPNPANPVTSINFSVPGRSELRIHVYDAAGRLVARLFEGIAEPGEHTVTWRADEHASGMYLIEMTAGEFRAVRKALIIK